MLTIFQNAIAKGLRSQIPINQKPSQLNILVVGLGGLGVVSLTRNIRNLVAKLYGQVHTIEQRGIAQRRSSTCAFLKAADHAIAPPSLAHSGEVDVLLALEPLEALRYQHLLGPNSLCLISDQRVETIGGCDQKFAYPSNNEILEALEQTGARCMVLPIKNMLYIKQLLPIHASTVMLGMFSAYLAHEYHSSEMNSAQPYDDVKNSTAYEWGMNQFNKIINYFEYSRYSNSLNIFSEYAQNNNNSIESIA